MSTKSLLTSVLLLGLALPVGAEEGILLRGRAVSGGAPLAGVKATLRPMVSNYGLGARFLDRRPPERPAAETETGADGRFVVEAPRAGFWSLELEAEGFAPFELLLLDVAEDRRLGELELEPAERLEVAVTDSEQRPLVARLSIFRSADALRGEGLKSLGRRWRVASSTDPGSPWRMLATDEKGRARVAVGGDDRLLVRALVPGFVAEEAVVHGGGKVRLTLRPGITRELRVLDTSQRPLPAVLVFDERAEVPLAVTDEKGRAKVTWEGAAALHLVLLDAGGRRGTARLEPPRVPPADTTAADAALTVTLEAPAFVDGRIVDRFNREPIVGALVWSNDLDNHATTGPGGDYRLLRLDPRAAVIAVAKGYIRGRAMSEAPGPAPTLALHPTVTLTGRVADPDGNPLANVEILVERDLARPEATLRGSGWGTASVRERTAEDGTFRVSGLPARMAFVLGAAREGWARTEMEIDPLEPFARRDGLYVILEPGRRGFGTVVDAENQPVAGARVTLRPRAEDGRSPRPPGDDDPRGETDASGRFVVADCAAGAYDLDIEHALFAPERVLNVEVLDLEDGTDLGTFHLEPGAVFEGRVIDREARPVAGAEIRFSDDPNLRVPQARRVLARGPAHALSDELGRFTLTGRRPGAPLTLVVESAAYLPEVVSGLSAPSATPLEIVLRSPSRVSGRVLDAAGQGVPGARLILIPEGRGGSGRGFGGPALPADGRDDGSFEIERVPPGRATLLAMAGDFRDARVSGLEVPEGGDLTDVEIVLRPGSTIEGAVLDPEGEPVTDALVRVLNPYARGKGARSDGDGRFRIAGLSAGLVSVAADHDDYPRLARDLELEPGVNPVDLVFGGGAAVSGRVHDALGGPVAGAWVRLVRAVRTRHSPQTVTGEDGGFLFQGVARGDYFVDAGRRGFAERRLEPPLAVRDEPVSGVEIELGGGSSLAGRILGLSDAELARVEVVTYGRLGAHHGSVEAGGSYRVEHLTPGDWVVRATVGTSGRSVVELLTLEPDALAASLDLDFDAGFTLSGTVTHAGAPLRGARIGARGTSVGYAAETTTDPAGAFRLEGLERGRYWIGLYDFASGLRHSEEIEIDGDRELSVELVTDRVAGMIVNAFDREPVEGARVVLEPVLEDRELAARLLRPTGLSDSGGNFSVGDVSHGRYDLVVSCPDYAESRTALEVRGPREGLEVELTPSAGIFFELSLAGGVPVERATAVVLDGDLPVAGGTWEVSEGGRLRITGVPAGSHEMLLWAPGSATVSRPILSPGDLGRIVLPRGGTLDLAVPELAGDGTVAMLRLIGADGRPYRSVFRARVDDEFRLLEGRARIPGLPTGIWSLLVEADDGRSWTTSATIQADRITEVALE